jgi:Polyketide cyclase / dehydrase and lipid transport
MLTALAVFAIVAAVVIAIVLMLAAAKPDTFHVERSTAMAAPPERILPLIDDFRNWRSWSPYEKLDPAMKRTLSGAESGKGAVYEWQGNGKAGQGRMEIAAVSPSNVAIDLRFLKPFRAHNQAEFRLEPQGGATKVTWAMDGKIPFAGKIMHTLFNMDRMIGKDFEAGLANLKTIAEK